MQKQLTRWLTQQGIDYPELIAVVGVLCLIAVISLIIHIIHMGMAYRFMMKQLNILADGQAVLPI